MVAGADARGPVSLAPRRPRGSSASSGRRISVVRPASSRRRRVERSCVPKSDRPADRPVRASAPRSTPSRAEVDERRGRPRRRRPRVRRGRRAATGVDGAASPTWSAGWAPRSASEPAIERQDRDPGPPAWAATFRVAASGAEPQPRPAGREPGARSVASRASASGSATVPPREVRPDPRAPADRRSRRAGSSTSPIPISSP